MAWSPEHIVCSEGVYRLVREKRSPTQVTNAQGDMSKRKSKGRIHLMHI
jgi:hypothetical protein